ELYRVGHTFDNGFTVAGGNDRTTFYLSGDNSYDQGVIVGPNDHFSRTAARLKASHRVADNLRLGGDLSFADTRARYLQRGNNTNGVQLGFLRTPPDFNNQPYVVTTPNGSQQQRSFFGVRHPTDASLGDDRIFDNPFWSIYDALNSSDVGRDPILDQEQVIHDASWFGQGTLDIKNQLYLTAALRNDGSSTFGRSNLRSWFPKGSAAWEFTKVIGAQSWLSYGKARVAYGQAGQEPLPYFTSQTLSEALLITGISQGTANTPTQNGLGGMVTRSELRAAT